MPAGVAAGEVDVQPCQRLGHVPGVDAGADVQAGLGFRFEYPGAHALAEQPALHVHARDDDCVNARRRKLRWLQS